LVVDSEIHFDPAGGIYVGIGSNRFVCCYQAALQQNEKTVRP
jgi:hypothetical protein